MNTLTRINRLVDATGCLRYAEPGGDLHAILDGVDRQLGIVTRHTYNRPSSIPLASSRAYVGERVRRLEAANVQRKVSAFFNGQPDYFHLGFEAEKKAA